MPSRLDLWRTKPGPESPLQDHINWHVRQGYRVVSQTEASAQLVKPKSFSFVWAFLWFLLAGIGLVVYLIYYAAKKDQQVYLYVESGQVVRR